MRCRFSSGAAAWRRTLASAMFLMLLALLNQLPGSNRQRAKGSLFVSAGSTSDLVKEPDRLLELSVTLSGRVVAYGDINLDGSPDVITLTGDSKLYSNLFVSDDEYKHEELFTIPSGQKFISVTVVMEPKSNGGVHESKLLIITESGGKVIVTLFSPNVKQAQILATDLDYEPTLVSIKNFKSPLLLSRTKSDKLNAYPVFPEPGAPVKIEITAPGSNLGSGDVIEHSSDAYLDLNGACVPDYFTIKDDYKSMEIFKITYSRSSNSFSAKSMFNINLEKNIKSYISFIDIGSTGNLDLVYVTCAGTACELRALLNTAKTRKPKEIGKSGTVCESEVSYSFSDTSTLLFKFNDASRSGNVPRYRLVVAHFENNLQSDILVAYNNEKHVLVNEYAKVADKSKILEGQYFQELKIKIEDRTVVNAVSVSLYVNLITSVGSLVVADNKNTYIFKKKYDEDAFSLSACIFWPQCSVSGCPGLSATMSGGNIRILVRNTAGEDKIVQLAQGAQAASQSLQLPCISTGLGRVNNFLQRIAIGGGQQTPAEFAEIIPNSVLIATHENNSWNLRMKLNARDHAIKVTIAFSVIIALLIILSAFLSWLEKREDERHRMYWI